MADEITLTVRASVAKGNLTSSFNPGSQTYDMTGDLLNHPVVVVGSGAEEDLATGDIAAADQGILCMRNLDATNFVKYGPKSGGVMVEFGRIKAGEIATFRLAPSVVLRWIADTAACNVEVWLLKN